MKRKKEQIDENKLDLLLLNSKLIHECRNGTEINDIVFENFLQQLNEFEDNYLGNDNMFSYVLRSVKKLMNFEIDKSTLTVFQTRNSIAENITKFREDFEISRFYRMENTGSFKCYVIISNLKPYWTITSIGSFLKNTKKIKIFDGEKTGFFLWVRLIFFKESAFFLYKTCLFTV